jgi:hypothetical protein
MTDEEILQTYSEMQARWGDSLPDPDVFPASFRYYVKMYLFMKANNVL